MNKAWQFYRRIVDAVYAPFFFGAFAFEAVRGASSTGVESVAHFGFAFALLESKRFRHSWNSHDLPG